MRRIIYISTVLIATVVALVACSKEDKNNEQAQATHSLNFVASQPETKTAMSISDGIATFGWEWSDTRNVHIYELNADVQVEGEVQASLDREMKIMSCIATFRGEAPARAEYYAHLNSDITTQNPSAESYDGRCDVLSARLEEIPQGREEVNLVFHREIAVNKMTIKGLGAGETISAVTLTSENHDIAGIYVARDWERSTNTLSIIPNGVFADEDGNAVIYFTCLPVTDAQLSVEVTTGYRDDMKTYRKDFAKPISFVKGQVKSFGVTVIEAGHGFEMGYEYVDLGLSVKWATMNVGATSPEEYGDYFAWGATVPWYEPGYAQEYPQAHWKVGRNEGYKFVHAPFQVENTNDANQTKWTKYLGSANSSYAASGSLLANPEKKVLDPEDDAAHVNWGGNWRMPTGEECKELQNHSKTVWTEAEINGVHGVKIESLVPGFTGNWIFMPLAGGYQREVNLYNETDDPSDLGYVGEKGRYWTSSLYNGAACLAYVLPLKAPAYDRDLTNRYRCFGLPIRPVCQ